MRYFYGLVAGLAFAFFGSMALAQYTPPVPLGPSVLGGQVSLSVTTSSANVALPASASAYGAITIYNAGSADAYIALGGSGVTAATSGGCTQSGGPGPACVVKANTALTLWIGQNTYLAGITAASSTTLVIYQGNGALQLSSIVTSGANSCPGGSNLHVLYSSNGSCSGDTGFTTNGSGVEAISNSLAIGGATIGSNALAVTGTANVSGTVTTSANVVVPATTISSNNAPTTGALLSTDGASHGAYMYFPTRGSVVTGTVDTEGVYPEPTGNFWTCVGERACPSAGSGTEDGGYGAGALQWVQTGNYNFGFGDNSCAGIDVSFGGSVTKQGNVSNCSALGFQACAALDASGGGSNGDNDICIGFQSGQYAGSSAGSIMIGLQTLQGAQGTPSDCNNSVAVGNTIFQTANGCARLALLGDNAAPTGTSGADLAGAGYGILGACTTCSKIAAVGTDVFANITTQSNDVGVGYFAGYYISGGSTKNTGGSNETMLGANTYPLGATDTNELVAGYNTTGNGSNTVTIGNSSVTDNYFSGTIHGASATLTGLSTAGLVVNSAAGALSSVTSTTSASTPANFSAAKYLTVSIGGTTYYIPADTAAW